MAGPYLQENAMAGYYNADPNLAYSMDYNNSQYSSQEYSSCSYQGYVEDSFGTWESSIESPSSLSLSDQENDPFQNLESVMQQDLSDCGTPDILRQNSLSVSECDDDPLDENSPHDEHHVKTKHSKNGQKIPIRKGHQRHAANVRERRRMKTINDAFEHLRVRVPTACDDRKMSKVDTLKMAIKYIGDLTDVLKSCGDGSLPGLRTKTNNKIMIKYSHTPESPQDMYNYGFCLSHCIPNQPYGHSLSWIDSRECAPVVNNKLHAPLWIPHHATAQELAAMSTDGA